MQLLRQGKGVMGKLAREHHRPDTAGPPSVLEPPHIHPGEDGEIKNKEVLHHLYNISGRSKISRVTKMLKSWLADPSKGKLCIFAHHLDVLGEISRGAGLSNLSDSSSKYIRIDGSTSPRARQDQILQFQTDPSIRVAMLGITAAGVAVTLTAASTVWFAELFWTPAIMIQAEDRCHRIGQQARVRCLYFIARGTLDEVLWKLIERKFRDLGEFVEGKENMGIALERELEDDEEDEILKTEDNGGGVSNKRKAQDVFGELLDPDDLELKKQIDELCNEEEDMLKVKNEEEEDEPDADEKGAATDEKVALGNAAQSPAEPKAVPSEMVIELLDDDDANDEHRTIAQIRDLYRETGVMARLKIDPLTRFDGLFLYTVCYPGPSYGLIMVSCNGRVVVKSYHSARTPVANPKIGSIIVGVNGYLIPYNAPFNKVLQLMKFMMRTPPVTVIFAEDNDFTSMFVEDFVPNMPLGRVPLPMPALAPSSGTPSSAVMHLPTPPSQNSEVIDLLDDDD